MSTQPPERAAGAATPAGEWPGPDWADSQEVWPDGGEWPPHDPWAAPDPWRPQDPHTAHEDWPPGRQPQAGDYPTGAQPPVTDYPTGAQPPVPPQPAGVPWPDAPRWAVSEVREPSAAWPPGSQWPPGDWTRQPPGSWPGPGQPGPAMAAGYPDEPAQQPGPAGAWGMGDSWPDGAAAPGRGADGQTLSGGQVPGENRPGENRAGGTGAGGTGAGGTGAGADPGPSVPGQASRDYPGPDPALPGPAGPAGDPRWAMAAYLTVPFFSFLVPLAVLLTSRRSPGVRAHAAQAANTALTVLLYDLSAAILAAVLSLDAPGVAVMVIGPLAAALWAISLGYLVRAASAAGRGEDFRLPSWLCATLLR